MPIKKNKSNSDYTEKKDYIMSFIVIEKQSIRSYATIKKNIYVPKKYKKVLLIHHNNHIKSFNYWIKEHKKNLNIKLTNKNINKNIYSNKQNLIDFSKFNSALIRMLKMEKQILEQYLSSLNDTEVNHQAFIKNVIQPHQLLHINNIKQFLG